jgi:methyl-accepting chemotaxis protein
MGEIVNSSAKIADITSIIDSTIQQNATVSETVAKTAGEITHESKSLLRLVDGLRGVVNGRNAA